jgi:tetratricopeptide (TPR) repeat protein
MRARSFLSALLGAGVMAGMLTSCVYYNGMYNANRLARSARKAEREGRTFEANNLWGQVATKAESVVVRHPTSKYAGEAAVLRGIALAKLGQCDQALGPLSRIGVMATPGELSEDALLATGLCQVAVGNLSAADAAFTQVLQSKNAAHRREARFQHARLLRQAGRYQEALVLLSNDRQSRADNERILALAGANRLPEALQLADSLMAKADSGTRWDSLVVALAAENPVAASGLVDRMRRVPKRAGQSQARLLLDDGLRLAKIDTARAAKRFREAVAAGSSDDAAGWASLELVRLDLRRAGRPEDLARIVETLKGLAVRFETISQEIARISSTIENVHQAVVSASPQTPQGDLRLFLAAESARDSLAAPRLAQEVFRRILEEWPTSPYAPKVILAAQQLDSTWVDSARVLLEERYLDSPYLAMVRGDASPAYRQLEDSLGAFAASLAPRPPAAAPRRQPPRGTPQPRRPQPTTGGSRVPEPQ